jgi:hypothetical protein
VPRPSFGAVLGTDEASRNPVGRWIRDDSFRPRPPDLAVYRYKASILPVLLFLPLLLIIWLVILADPYRDQVAGYVIAPVIMWNMASSAWLWAVTTAVRVRPGALIIDNGVIRHVIPWERFAGLFANGSQGMFAQLDDGKEVRSASFARSLKFESAGETSHLRHTLDRVRADCRQARAGHVPAVDPGYQRRLNVPWRALLGLLVSFEAVSWIAFALNLAFS